MIKLKQATSGGQKSKKIVHAQIDNYGKKVDISFSTTEPVAEKCYLTLTIDRTGLEYLEKLVDLVEESGKENEDE